MDGLISVIVPVYNVEKYIDKCINSIVNQTYGNLEIILVNDGSTDNSRLICEKFKLQDKRIILINQKNCGLSSARNTGLNKATGQFIAFIDSDDYIHEQTFELLIEVMSKEECQIAICNIREFYENEIIKSEKVNLFEQDISINSNRTILGWIFSENGQKATIACNKLYKSDLFYNQRFPLGKLHEDVFFIYKIIAKANKIAYLDKRLYYYLQRENSITAMKINKKSFDYLDAMRETVNFFENDEQFLRKNRVLEFYMHILADYYYKSIIYLPEDKVLQNNIRSEMFSILKKNKNKLKFSIKETTKFFILLRFTICWIIIKRIF